LEGGWNAHRFDGVSTPRLSVIFMTASKALPSVL